MMAYGPTGGLGLKKPCPSLERGGSIVLFTHFCTASSRRHLCSKSCSRSFNVIKIGTYVYLSSIPVPRWRYNDLLVENLLFSPFLATTLSIEALARGLPRNEGMDWSWWQKTTWSYSRWFWVSTSVRRTDTPPMAVALQHSWAQCYML